MSAPAVSRSTGATAVGEVVVTGSGRYWQEFIPGESWRTGERRLEAADLDAFSGLSGDLNPLHLDDAYARRAGYEGRIAQGVLGLAVMTGLLNRLGLTSGTLVALLGTTWRFERALRPGTTVHGEVTVSSARASSRGNRGVVVLSAVLCDDEGGEYQRGELVLLVRGNPEEASGG